MRWEVEPLQNGLLYKGKVWPVPSEGPRTQVFSTKTEALAWVQGFALCPIASALSKFSRDDWCDLVETYRRLAVSPDQRQVVAVLEEVRELLKGIK